MIAPPARARDRFAPGPLRRPGVGRTVDASFALTIVVAAFSIILLRAPTLLGPGQTPALRLAALAPFILAIGLFALSPRPPTAYDRRLLLLGSLFLTVVSGGIVRQGLRGDIYSLPWSILEAFSWCVFFAFTFVALAGQRSPTDRRRMQAALIAALPLYVLANILLDLAGVRSQTGTVGGGSSPAQLLSFIGLSGLRTGFPLGGASANSFGPIAGTTLAVCLAAALSSSLPTGRPRVGVWRRAAAWVGALLATYALLRADSRAALFFGLLAAAAVLILGRRRRWLAVLALLVPVSSLIVVVIASAVGEASWAEGFTRVQGGSVATASERTLVWQPVFDLIDDAPPDLLLGYGAFGQIASGVSAGYAGQFTTSGVQARTLSAHNLGLQTLLDVGVVGLVLLVLVMAMTMVSLAQARDEPRLLGALAGVGFLTLIGFTEAAPTIFSGDAFAALLILVAVAVTSVRGRETEIRR